MPKLKQLISNALARLRRWAAPPVFEDPVKTRTVALVNVLMLAGALLWPVFLVLLAVLHVGYRVNMLMALATSLLLLGVREVMRRGHVGLAAALGIGLSWATVTGFLYNLGTVYSVHLAGYLLVVFMATWLGGVRAAGAAGLLSVVSVFVLARAEIAGLLPPATVMPSLNLILNLVAYLSASAFLLLLVRATFMRTLVLAHDEIAQRTAAQAALQRSAASLKAAERIAHMGTWERDLISGELYVSDEFCHVFGIATGTSAETAFAAGWDAVHPDDAAGVKASYERALQTGGRNDLTFRITLPSGETRVMYGVSEVRLDAAGQPVHIRATAQDVTEQERVRQELDQRVKELLLLQDLGHPISLELPLEEFIRTYLARIVTIAGLDLAQVFLLREGRLHLAGVCSDWPAPVGGAYAERVPLTPDRESPSGQSPHDPGPPAPRACGAILEAGECLCVLAVQGGQTMYAAEIAGDPRCTSCNCPAYGVHSLAALPLRSREAIIGVLALGALAPDALAGQLGFLETIADLVAVRLHNALLHQEIQARAAGLEQTVAERTMELQAERDRTQAILDTMGESVIVTDVDGQTSFINPATAVLTGYSRDETLGQPIWRHWPAQVFKEIWPQAQQALRGGQTWRGEVTGYRQDATMYTVALTGTPLRDARGSPLVTGGVWVQRDITAAKEAERLKDQFISNISHELRTPLASIKAYTELLLAGVEVEDKALRLRFLSVIDAEADQLAQFINNLLDISRLQAGPMEGQVELISPSALMIEVAKSLDIQAQRAGVTIRFDFPDSLPMLCANKELMESMTRNLIGNAIKYSAQGGTVCVAARAAEGAIVLEVTDQGIGIPPEDLPHLFTRFYRSRSARQSGIGGTGLGLAVAKEAVERHGGTITVESQVGVGTRFTVTLPFPTIQAATEMP